MNHNVETETGIEHVRQDDDDRVTGGSSEYSPRNEGRGNAGRHHREAWACLDNAVDELGGNVAAIQADVSELTSLD